jgi:hypothetical protein
MGGTPKARCQSAGLPRCCGTSKQKSRVYLVYLPHQTSRDVGGWENTHALMPRGPPFPPSPQSALLALPKPNPTLQEVVSDSMAPGVAKGNLHIARPSGEVDSLCIDKPCSMHCDYTKVPFIQW